MPLRPQVQGVFDQTIDGLRKRLGDDIFTATWNAGFALPLESAVEQAQEVFAAIVRTANATADLPFGLSRREYDVLRLLAEGYPDKEIATMLFISSRTVSSHVAAITGKLGVESRTAAVVRAIRLGLA